MGDLLKEFTFCFYCHKHRLTAKKRKTFARTICDECVEIRRPKNARSK